MTEERGDYDPNRVMPRQCSSCPWRQDGGVVGDDESALAALRYQALKVANQYCHAPGLRGKPETHICRGARDYQLEIYHRLGVLEEPTDECWAQTLEILQQKS